jgi:hypothetical protein
MRRWQLGVFGALSLVLVIVVGSFFTPYGFARAADTENKAAAIVKPLADSVHKIDQRLSESETVNRQMLVALNELRAVAIAGGIDRLIRRRCIETDIGELQALRRDIDAQKNLYFNLAKIQYSEPSCAEVRR